MRFSFEHRAQFDGFQHFHQKGEPLVFQEELSDQIETTSNYDLPWNPMKVEQRIGRLDRIGQESESISILNLCHEGTIDHRIVERLHKRLGVFTTSIGELEPILGPVIYQLTSDLVRHDLTPQEIDARLEQTEQAIEQEKRNNEELEKEAPNLLAHGDYILQKVKAARDFRQRISHDDLIAYVKYFFDNYAQGHTFRQIDQSKSTYEIQLPTDVAADYNAYVADKKSSGATRLQSGQPVKCQFANKVHQLTRNLEQISQFHPLIRYIEVVSENWTTWQGGRKQAQRSGRDNFDCHL